MNKVSKYRILPELQLMIECYSGDIDVNSIIEFKKTIIEDKDYNSGFRLISDFRNTNFLLNLDKVLELIELFKQNKRMTGKRYTAILTDTPNQVAIASLYQINLSELPMTVEIFSTIESSIYWLGISHDKLKLIEQTIYDLKNNTD